jgi:predicted phosphodiesterase
MRLHVLSDLHLEYAPFTSPDVDADVVVLAGDTAPGVAGVEWAARTFVDRPVLYLAGNHEFYNHALPSLTEELRAAAAGGPVQVLENDAVVIAGTRFLGCTLWSDFELAGRSERKRSMSVCSRVVNDFKLIRRTGSDQLFHPQDALALHQRSRAWLAEQLAVPFDGPTVVLTHHAPLVRERPQNPVLAAIGGAFASDLSALMGADLAQLWVFGHVHRCVDTTIDGTRVISNQRGYPHEPVDGFDPALVIEL